MEINVVGVYHGGIIEIWGCPTELRTYPSPGLEEILESLPSGTEVGLETWEPEPEPEVEYQQLLLELPPLIPEDASITLRPSEKFMDLGGGWLGNFADVVKDYWKRATDICQRQGLKIVYLDNLDLYLQGMQKMVAREKIFHFVENVKTDNENGQLFLFENFLEDLMAQLGPTVYCLSTEGQYAQELLRDQDILETIAQHPSMKWALVGQGHSDYWIVDSDRVGEQGITISKYLKEVLIDTPIQDWELSHDSIWRETKLQDQFHLDESSILHLKTLQRKFRAVTAGRILSDGKPDFIGTWDVEIPARGLFEIYIQRRTQDQGRQKIAGTIEDAFGSAQCVGVIEDRRISFNKTYFNEGLKSGGFPGEITYAGVLCNGQYEGEFNCPERKARGRFTLKPVSKE